MPLGLPVDPEVYSRNSGCSALTHTGSHTGLCPSMTSCHHRSRASFIGTSWPVRFSTMTLRMLRQPCDSALSAASLSSMTLPARQPPSAVISTRGRGILDAVLERHRRETAEHHRVDGADARAGVHRDDGLDGQRHVDDDAIALLHALRD